MPLFPAFAHMPSRLILAAQNLRAGLKAAALAALLATLPSLAVAEPILTVTGGPDAAGKSINVTYDLAALQALPKTTFETTTMWTEGMQSFEGVDLKTLLDVLNVETGTVIATAINDYRIEIPVAEIAAGGPMIAYLMNGAEMPVRDKGPLWIVYPYDSDAQYQSEVVFSRSIWQLVSIEIAP